MIHTAIAKSYPTPATFDAGRRPSTHIPFNTPQTKTKRSATGRKHIARDVFCPQAISTPRKTPLIGPKVNEASDDDIPLALVMQLHSASLLRRPSTVKRPGPIRSPAVEVDDDEDLPLIKIKERMTKKFNLRPIIQRVVHRQPPKKVVQTVRDLGPTSTPMVCIVPDCPYDWHVHANTVSH